MRSSSLLRGNIYVTMGVSDDDKHCYVRVEDSGVGIPQSKLSEIFERFSQADNARGAYYAGNGHRIGFI